MRFSLLIIVLAIFVFPADGFSQKRKKKRRAGPMPFTSPLRLDPGRSAVFKKSFTGFAVYDPEKGEMVYEYNSDKYFTPASNTKILTFYTSLQLLGDSIPALHYEKHGNFFVFWGTGDPSFLNPRLQANERIFRFLKNRPEILLFCPANFRDQRYGEGWMWSDYPYSYQPEKSPFPVYGNVARFVQSDTTGGLRVVPAFLKDHLFHDPSLSEDDYIGRLEFDNRFSLNDYAAGGGAFEQQAPFRITPDFVAKILADTLRRPVNLLEENLLPPPGAGVLYSTPADSLYTLMMQQSDNFIAEQLLLLCSDRKFGWLNTSQIIEYALDSLLNDLPDPPEWVDGSGLSRYNLITPRSLVYILDKIQKQLSRPRLLRIFPGGGISGTIENNYKNGRRPYVFAKTGTLRNNHCLSGYLLTSRGKLLIFSFMHNNFTVKTSLIKKEMEKFLWKIYLDY